LPPPPPPALVPPPAPSSSSLQINVRLLCCMLPLLASTVVCPFFSAPAVMVGSLSLSSMAAAHFCHPLPATVLSASSPAAACLSHKWLVAVSSTCSSVLAFAAPDGGLLLHPLSLALVAAVSLLLPPLLADCSLLLSLPRAQGSLPLRGLTSYRPRRCWKHSPHHGDHPVILPSPPPYPPPLLLFG
jgi:hypothetical protein